MDGCKHHYQRQQSTPSLKQSRTMLIWACFAGMIHSGQIQAKQSVFSFYCKMGPYYEVRVICWFRYFIPHLNQMSSKLTKAINQRLLEEGGPEQAIELDLSGLDLSAINKDVKKLLDKAKGIEVLVISDNKLTSLEGLPEWKLSSLNATNNQLNDAALGSIAKYTDLSELLLDNNDIKTLEALAPIFTLKELIKLELLDNPVTKLPDYREHILEKMPHLQVLDGLDREGNEVEEELEDDEGDEDEDGEEGSESSDYDEDEDDDAEDSEPKPKKK